MLAVAGGKGGSGKTTTALGLASALVERRRRPLVVDCDLDAPNLHLRADVPRDPGVDAPNPTAHEATTVPGVDVLPVGDASGDDLAVALDALPETRPTILDCPAGASEAAVRPLRAADGCVVVATDSREGIEDAVKTAAMARAVGTTVRAVAVTRAGAVPDGLANATAADTVPIPAAAAPLETAETAAAYATLAGYVEPNA